MKALIEFEDLTIRRSKRTVLRGVNWDIKPGITAFIGQNGTGKTTLMLAILGLIPISSGLAKNKIESAEFLFQNSTMKYHNTNISWLPQEYNLPEFLTVNDLYRHVAWLRQVSKTQIPKQIAQLLAAMKLSDKADTKIGKLSGGEKRRAALGSVMLNKPQIIVLDEPTVALDPIQRTEILAAIKQYALSNPQVAVVFSTHILEDVVQIADRIAVLKNGALTQIDERATSELINANPNPLDYLAKQIQNDL